MYICTYVYMYICIYVQMYICTYVYYMILLYLEDSGSKFHSVNTKTSQFPPFFGFQELRKNMSTPKLVNFPHFWIPEVEKKHVYIYIYLCVHMYITWFCYIWRVVVLSFIPSTRKLVNFLHFLDSRNWEKTCIYNMYICTYVYYMILLYLEGSGSKFHFVNTKTGQFSSFFGFQKCEKKHVNTKTRQFSPFFGFQELRKNTHIYIHIYNINMYICILHDFAIFGW